MDERIKAIRKKFNYSQQKFANELGISRGNIAAYEVGKNAPSDAVISLICTKFNINEEWLRYGKGNMQKIPRGGKLSEYLAQIASGDDDFIQDLIEVYFELDPVSREALKKIRDAMLKKRIEGGEI